MKSLSEDDYKKIIGELIGSQSTPSIPTKFRTVHVIGKEPKAFNITARRFKAYRHDTPAPSEYQKEEGFTKHRSSYSSKGYSNGFVSQTDRFPKLRRTFLGPGAYDPKWPREWQPKQLDGTCRNFKPSVAAPPKNTPTTPGPNMYHYQEPATSSGAQFVFRSKSRKVADSLKANMHVAPGIYEPPKLPRARSVFVASFKSNSKRGELKLEKTPGPCSYDVEPLVSAKSISIKRPFTSVLSKHLKALSAQPIKVAPPPVKEPATRNVPRRKLTLSSSFFLSESRRGMFQEPKEKRPGPSDYYPTPLNSMSFHMSNKPEWIC